MSLTLIFLFSFISLVLIAIGVVGRSPAVIVIGGIIMTLFGVMVYVEGMTEYDGTSNSTVIFKYLDTANTSIANMTTTKLANYYVRKDIYTNGLALVLALAGAFGAWYGIDLARREDSVIKK